MVIPAHGILTSQALRPECPYNNAVNTLINDWDVNVVETLMQNFTDRLIYILKMLGFYPDTFIIDHKFCSMLSILNTLTLQKELRKG